MQVTDLGRMSYVEALAVQRDTHQRVAAGESGPTLLLVEHDPVLTVGRRAALRGQLTQDVLVDDARLAKLGIDVQPSDRGGQTTYHGPGQLVIYPILRLADLKLLPATYVRLLESAVIDTLASFGIQAARRADIIGVWVARSPHDNATGYAKICALGVRIKKGASMHGLALNVTTNLDHFKTIVPCGLLDCDVTSLLELRGDAAPSIEQVKTAMVESIGRHLAEAG
jgi:lipoyl(octanoyl) transferase